MKLKLASTIDRLTALAATICASFALVVVISAREAAAQGVDIEAVFNCSPGGPIGEQTLEECLSARNTLLNYCTSCHTFVPVVKAQKSPEGWDALMIAHRKKAPEPSDAAYEELNTFLKSHYNETEPVPTLPPALEALGTNEAA